MTRSRALAWLISLMSALSAVLVFSLPANAAVIASAPFSWQGYSWCPTYKGSNGCDNVQSPSQFTVSFDPNEVLLATNGDIMLQMNAAATRSGAFNSDTQETWNPGTTFSESIYLPCNSSSQIENWPAFWTTGTVGGWPKEGEIDIMEGLKGLPKWHYHYVNASGANAQVGGTLASNGCGWHTYAADWTSSAITFYFDGTQKGQVAESCASPCVSIGVPVASDPMIVRNDYGANPTYGGPTAGDVRMHISAGTFSP